MPETVYLAPTDEITSIKDKMDRAKGNPIIVVAPRSVKALRNPLVVKLLKRHARFLGKDVALVLPDRISRELAHYHGLPAFASLTQVRRWKPGARAESPAPDARFPFDSERSVIGTSGIAIGFLSVIAFLIPAVMGYLFIPSANVSLFAATQTLSETVAITATTDANSIDYKTNTIPARIIETAMEFSDQIDIAGKKPVPDAAATGQVTLMNKVGTKVTVPKGTLVGTRTGIKFRTGDDVTLPATMWSSARVGIIADQPGKASNLDRMTIDQMLDPQLVNQVTVLNEIPTQGGTDKEVGAVTAQDQTNLETQALAKAKNDVLQKLFDAKSPSESIYPQSLSVQVVDEQFDRKIGEETTKTLSVKLVLRGSGVAFEARDVNNMIHGAVESKLPAGLKITSDGISIKPLGAITWTDKTVSFYVQGDAKAVTDLDEEKVKRDLAGMNREEAEKYLAENLVLANPPEVRLDPFWNTTVPRFGWRVKINLRVP